MNNGMPAAKSAIPAATSRAFGFTPPARWASVGVATPRRALAVSPKRPARTASVTHPGRQNVILETDTPGAAR